MNRTLLLTFSKHPGNEYELQSIAVDGIRATASKQRDKRNGDKFQWKPGSGIAALSLFFVESWLRLETRSDTIRHIDRPIETDVIPIWKVPLNDDRKIGIDHPLGAIRANLIRNRFRSSLYLYRLFYHRELESQQVSFLELNQSKSPHEPAVIRNIERADRIDSSFRNEFDELIYLGCLLIERGKAEPGDNLCTAYLCLSKTRGLDISIVVSNSSDTKRPRPARTDEVESIRTSLNKHFPRALEESALFDEPIKEASQEAGTRIRGASPTPKNTGTIRWAKVAILLLCGALAGHFLGPSPSTQQQPESASMRTEGLAQNSATEPPPPPQPSLAEVEHNKVQVFSQSGEIMWSKQFKGWVLNDQALLEDLDGDRNNEIIVTTAGYDIEKGGSVTAYTSNGEELWTYTCTSKPPYDKPSSGKFAIREVYANDLYGVGKQQLILLIYDAHGWGCSGIVVINWDGRPLWTYWHPGHVTDVVIGCRSPETPKQILVGAINNAYAESIPGPFTDSPKSLYPRTVFMLNPFPAESSPPHHRETWDQTAMLRWYYVIAPEPTGIEKLDIIDHDYDGGSVVSLWVTAGQGYYIDFDGNVIDSFKTAGPLRETTLIQVYPKDELQQKLNDEWH